MWYTNVPENMYPVYPKLPLKIMHNTKIWKNPVYFIPVKGPILDTQFKIPLYTLYLKTLADPGLSYWMIAKHIQSPKQVSETAKIFFNSLCSGDALENMRMCGAAVLSSVFPSAHWRNLWKPQAKIKALSLHVELYEAHRKRAIHFVRETKIR